MVIDPKNTNPGQLPPHFLLPKRTYVHSDPDQVTRMFGSTVFVQSTLFWETTTKSSLESSSATDFDKWFNVLVKGFHLLLLPSDMQGLMVAPKKLIFQGFGTSSLSPLPWKAEIRVRKVMQPLLDEMQLYFIHVTESAILTSLWSFAYEKKVPSLRVVVNGMKGGVDKSGEKASSFFWLWRHHASSSHNQI